MNRENAATLNTESILENLTRTLLYEGYALYPYHRSAIKNQKPVPFGVVFPYDYNFYNEHAHSTMQTQCIVNGRNDLLINIDVRFLHLKRTELLGHVIHKENACAGFAPVHNFTTGDNSYQAGWQTIERRLSTGDLLMSDLIRKKTIIRIGFDSINDSRNLNDENDGLAARETNSVSAIKGAISIEAAPVENMHPAFRVTVNITNTTPVENAASISRDEVISQSFLSTHTILKTTNAEFISHQNPGEQWKSSIGACENINTWPILVDESNSTLLSSPIILYDYPQINPHSQGDLFDSTEIEEALLLHINLLSDEEKKRIGQGDEKLAAMLQKVSEITPAELINFHSGLETSTENKIINEKKSEL